LGYAITTGGWSRSFHSWDSGAPLKDLTKKGAFHWIEESQQTFDKMKEVMSTCPVLALPDISQLFVLECDASEVGIGAVLIQGGQPIGFIKYIISYAETK